MVRKIFLFLLAVLVIIQFIHPKKNKATGPQPHYIGNNHVVPANVKSILSKACNDCHSNNTLYPWYAKLQPVHWWLNKHVNNGKKGLNFDEYTNRSLRYQYHKMEETIDMVKEGEMPLDSYTWIHKDAILEPAEKELLLNWAANVMTAMEAKYPIDSLRRKK